jgi:hypothetical protein
MSKFHVLEELPQEAQTKSIESSASPVAQRTSTEAAYLAARVDYLDNRVDHGDTDGLIDRASGLIGPQDGQPGSPKVPCSWSQMPSMV